MKAAREFMTPDPACCTKKANVVDVARLMEEWDCGEIPIIEEGESRKLIGVITDRDIVLRCVARGKNPAKTSAGECMSTPALAVSTEASIDDCIATMRENQVRRVPVVDADGRICGIVSQADIARWEAPERTGQTVRDVSQTVSPPH